MHVGLDGVDALVAGLQDGDDGCADLIVRQLSDTEKQLRDLHNAGSTAQ